MLEDIQSNKTECKFSEGIEMTRGKINKLKKLLYKC